MTDKYDESLFEGEDTVTIPDFVEDKSDTQTSSLTDSTSVDMSIFKMSDDELYDDDETESHDRQQPRKKGSGLTVALCLILILLLLATSVAAIFYALKQRSAYQDLNAKYLQLQANQDNFQKQLAEKDALIADLNKQLEEKKDTPAQSDGTLYVVVDGPIHFKAAADYSSDNVTYNGKETAENGEKFSALELLEDESDPGRRWIKLADGVYLCVGFMDSDWAKKAE